MDGRNDPSLEPLFIYGAGGHGLVVAEAAVAAGWRVLGFVDDDVSRKTVGVWSIHDDTVLESRGGEVKVIVAIGDNEARHRIFSDLKHRNCKFATVIHPHAWVSPSAYIGHSVFIGASAAVQAQVHLDDGVIVNNGAIVDHHCRIEPFAHIAPGATLGGDSSVGNQSLVGIGATVLPGTSIGAMATVGGGATVIDHVGDNQTVVGVPARPK